MWIYKYIRADFEEIDMGYPTKEEAERAMTEHSSLGALCTGPEEKSDDYKLYKGGE